MKIGLVCPYNLFKGGGVQECVLAQYAELKKRGHDVRILTPRPRNVPEDHSEDIIFIGAGRDIKTPFHTTAQVSSTVKNETVDRMLVKESFDVIHFHEPWISAISRQILSRSKARNIATFHAKLPETMMSRTIERVATPYMKTVLKYLDTITAVSDAAAEYVSNLTDQPVIIIPNGINLDHYRITPQPKSSKKQSILYIGRLEKRKGVNFLLQAFAELAKRNPDAELFIAGDGPDRDKLEMYVDGEKIPRVHFLGYVSQAQKMQLLNDASLFCSPALFGESFGIVLLEAMAMSIPIVAGNNPGYVSVLRGRGRLSLVNPKDTTEFTRRLEILLDDQELRQIWKSWAKAEVTQYDYPTVVDQYEKLYQL